MAQSTYNAEKKRISKDIIKPPVRMRIDEIKPAPANAVNVFQEILYQFILP